MSKLDDYLLDIHQRTADWLQAWTGKDCFFYGMCCVWLATVCDIIQIVLELATAQGQHRWAQAVFQLVCCAFRLLVLGLWTLVIKKLQKPELMNDHGPSCWYRYMLILFLALAVVAYIGGKHDTWVFERIFIVSWAYFVGCTPKPKAKSKLKSAVEKLSTLMSPLPNAA